MNIFLKQLFKPLGEKWKNLKSCCTRFTLQKLTFCVICCGTAINTFGQCTSPIDEMFPYDEVSVSAFNDTLLITDKSYPGSYFILKELKANQVYRITSSAAGDYFTIRNKYTNALLGHGIAPYDYQSVANPDVIAVHIHTSLPPCGETTEWRTTKVICLTCTPPPPKVGINNSQPKATLDVSGRIKLDDTSEQPTAGSIRWNNDVKDFEGYNGTKWLSLTKSNAETFGAISSSRIGPNHKLIDYNGASGDIFGSSVAIYGDYAAVGSPGDDYTLNDDRGSVIIFRKNGSDWIPQTKLVANDGATSDRFGTKVALWGDFLAVGVPFDDIGANVDQGSVYIYFREGSQWIFKNKLSAIDGSANDWFGWQIALYKNNLLVGVPLADINSNNDQGSVYAYVQSGGAWNVLQKITNNSSPQAFDYFGYSVALHERYAAIGSIGDDINGKADQGSVSMYLGLTSGYAFIKTIIASDGAAGDEFGYNVAISAYPPYSTEYLVVGAVGDDLGGPTTNQGSVYVYEKIGFGPSTELKLSFPSDLSQSSLGSHLACYGEYIVVGGSLSTPTVMYKFDGSVWVVQALLETFGFGKFNALSMSKDHLIAGNQEAAFIFNKSN